jgi:two-component system cell cycle sensor histidine kinase/response regulator CckA
MGATRILLVEDDPVIAAELQASLQQLGYDVPAICKNGREAVKTAYTLKPDVALVNTRLKGRPTGVETGSSLRHAHQIPVIFMAERADITSLEGLKTPALFGFIHRPFERGDLKVAIELALFRHRSEQLLEENSRWFASALDSLGQGVIATDRDGIISYMNPAAEAITLWKRKDALGRPLEELGVARHIDSDGPGEVIGMKTLRDGVPEGDDTRVLYLLDRTGQRKDILASASPILSAGGGIEGVIVVIHDVTSRRIHERHHHSIEKMEVLGKLSSTVAHEFSTLFSVIAGFASSVLDGLSGGRGREELQKVLDAARHGQDLTRRILVIARASNAEGDIRLQAVSLKQTIKHAIEIAHPALARGKVEVKFQETEHMPHVMADAAQLVDVLTDFLYNAAEAMPAGGTIRITVQDQAVKRADIKSNPKALGGHYAVIRIADHGTGIAPEVIERIFEPFFSTKKTRGVGLGLAVANSAILGYGGWIRVRSKLGEGSTFHLFIPAAPTKQEPRARKEQAPQFLLIDHEPDLLNETAAILKAEGFRVQTAGTAVDGLALYHKNPDAFTLCIVDAIMPDMETGELVQKLLEIKPGTPMVITSGFSRDYMRRFMPRSEWAFILKPVERDTLLGAINRLLSEMQDEATPA